MSAPLRLGLVGAGRIAAVYAEALESASPWPAPACFAGVADPLPEAAAAFAARVGCPGFDSHLALADAVPLDAVVICTPPATHAAIACHFLRRGIHVLCEKPLSVDLRGARLMALEAARSGALLTMASKFRFVDDVVYARSLVRSGAIGDLVQVENAFTSRVAMAARWNSVPALSGGGVLIDNGAHAADLLRLFLGPLTEVQAAEGQRRQGLAVEETVRLMVRNAAGVLGSVDLSWSFGKETDSYLTVFGTEGAVEVGWRESRWRRTASRDWIPFGAGYHKVRAFRAQLENFVRAVRGEEEPRVTLADALASVEVIEAAYRALQAGRWTAVAPFHRRRRPRGLSLVAGAAVQGLRGGTRARGAGLRS